ncbi:MAG: GNAT family N-acetyltransferase [Saprospiraceae bacterium]|nr:GNAT family N-acetyltransferase [Saprospiraceae bacterium]
MLDVPVFDVKSHYLLENEVAYLRPLTLEDMPHLLPFALDEADLWQYSLTLAAGEKGLKHYIELAVAKKEKGNAYPFIVWDKRSKAYAGSTRFYDIEQQHRCLSVGYTWYGKQFQGTGLNKHCKWLMLSFAFETLCMERVEFRADSCNQRSIAAMKSIGCQVEGILRSNAIRPDGTRRNSIVLSILKSEWESGAKEKLCQRLSEVGVG